MANAYLAPGAYVEEVPSTTPSFPGGSTSTIGIIGVVENSIDVPVLLADNVYQDRLKKAQADAYGNDDDYTDAGVNARLAKANADLAAAQAAAAPQPVGAVPAQLTNALQREQNKLQQAAGGPADVLATAQANVDRANADIAAFQAAPQPVPDGAAKALVDAQAEVARLSAVQKLAEGDRKRDARGVARSLAKASVSRYTTEKFEIKVPVAQAKLCTNFSEYQKRFGQWSAYPADVAAAGDPDVQLNGHQVLTHAVYDAFNNGASRIFVIRVTRDNIDNDLIKALNTMESIEEISIVAFPGESADPRVSAQLVAHCQKAKYRFAVLDVEPDPLDDQKELDLELLTYDTDASKLPFRTKDAACYFPPILVTDPALQLQQAGSETIRPRDQGVVYAPCSGAVCGIYARTDSERGVFKAPANASVLGALNVKYYIGRSAQEGLNPQGVNCIRRINEQIALWGARTCGGDENMEWRYVSVRRLYLYIAKSIDRGTQWAVFEPNDQTTWGALKRSIDGFLTTLWRQGALFGETPEEAFYIKCDEENNPQETRDIGQLVVEVGIAPVKPAEFVIIRIQQDSLASAK